ncbi:hypothetical protein L21SP2_3103 [Salinispira pacifica]|uniref:Uncharacterized protein n=1 Tax=Salinispira pacifica TaxID=1307761 RepID=V5WLB0_9SPIO|nr:hypothetical protein L21SP2_3103 [Salinispira pacifica]
MILECNDPSGSSRPVLKLILNPIFNKSALIVEAEAEMSDVFHFTEILLSVPEAGNDGILGKNYAAARKHH